MIKTILKTVIIIGFLLYSFELGYEQGYKDRENKFVPDDYYNNK